MQIRPAILNDIDAIMACERQAGYEDLVGRWTREQHATGIADPTHRYLVAVGGGGKISGYLMLQGIGASPESVLIKRIAVMQPGGGVGRALIERALSVIFDELAAKRVTLTVRPHNERGVALYRRVGLTNDGVEEVLRNGKPAFNTVMSMNADTYRIRQAANFR
ncbi:GNAT family N-acetyltransferase [Microvirga sp. TS319]|uniref:GNAT family N-acetyltransferase n=1 Tax=Microvirga sp. TS319 TaxID=3241165 RepID=UPI003519DF6F